MASASITTRSTKTGEKRFLVRYRLGGRAYPLVHAGSFRTLREARARRDLVAGELAAGRNPNIMLAAQPATVATFSQWADRWLVTRVDLDESTVKAYGYHVRHLAKHFDQAPEAITVADVQQWIAASGLAATSLQAYGATLKQILDFAGSPANAARDRLVRFPRIERTETTPPTAHELLTILETVTRRWRLGLVTLEQTAMRANEAETLEWPDVDVRGNRFRLRAKETKSGRARWVQVPGWLMSVIADSCPTEDRVAGRRVFRGFTADGAYQAMARACKQAGLPHYHPHDLRHRRASIWHGSGVSTRELMERGGWARSSIPIDTYSHVMPLDEAPQERLEALAVMHRRGLCAANRLFMRVSA